MNEREFRWYEGKHGEHPSACTCRACRDKRRKREDKERFGGKIECPMCGYLSINWVEGQKRYVCSNPECRISGQTLFELSHGAVTLPLHSETEIPKPPLGSETQISAATVASQKEILHKRTSPTLVRVLLTLVLIVIIGFALSKFVTGVKTAIPNASAPTSPSTNSPAPSTPADAGFVDPLALNPATDSYLNQTWGGQTIDLTAGGTSKLCYRDDSGHIMCDTYIGTNTEVTITNSQTARNPTMAELLAFLKQDRTEDYAYSYPSFVCTNYAVTLHNNAEANGIRCAFVAVSYAAPPGHALNAFETTDEGLVLIDDTSGVDAFAKITMGQEIVEVPVFMSDFQEQISVASTPEFVIGGEMWW
jgi:hypothetical protein